MRTRSRQSGLGTKSYLAIGCGVFALITFACCGLGSYYAWDLGASARKQLAAANRDWDAGRKADAVSKYKSIIESDLPAIPKGERSLVFQRVIEFEIEQGQTESARSFIEKAI